MKRHTSWWILAVVLAALAGGLAVLFRLRLGQGDTFPPYSSLRADPLGTRALHDSLDRVGGLRVERSFRALRETSSVPARTILLAGYRGRSWNRVRRDEFEALDAALRGGSRVVLALWAVAAAPGREDATENDTEDEAPRRRTAVQTVDLRRTWGADLKERWFGEQTNAVLRTADESAAGLPTTVPWRSDQYFALNPDSGWRVIYRRGGEPVLVERTIGKGSVVLAADAYFLSNESLQNDRAAALLAWVVGPHAHVVFNEAHLGVVAQPGVAALARRYGLSGAFFTLLLLAGLFVWRRMALFVPPVEETDEVALTYHPAAGLEALLRRSVAPGELAVACATEWKATAQPGDRLRVEKVVATAAANASPVSHYNAATRALKVGARASRPRPDTISP